MKDFYAGKKVLVTGHTGFKGAWLTKILLAWGADVVGVSLPPATTPSAFDAFGLEGKITNHFLDIREYDKLEEIFLAEKPEIVFHLAAQALVRPSYDAPLTTFSTNCIGTANILEAIKTVGCVKSAVIVTTDKVYENREIAYAYKESDSLGGHDPYSSSKAAADIIAHSYIRSFFNPKDFGTKHATLVAIARAGNVVGGGDWADYRLIPDIIRSVYHDKTRVEIRNPAAVRPWQHVLEPLSGYLMLAQRLYEGESSLSQAWNFGPYPESHVPVEGLLVEAKKRIPGFVYDIVPDGSKHEASLLMLDITKSVNVLGWKPKLSFEELHDFTFDWYMQYYEKPESIADFTDKQITLFFKQ